MADLAIRYLLYIFGVLGNMVIAVITNRDWRRPFDTVDVSNTHTYLLSGSRLGPQLYASVPICSDSDSIPGRALSVHLLRALQDRLLQTDPPLPATRGLSQRGCKVDSPLTCAASRPVPDALLHAPVPDVPCGGWPPDVRATRPLDPAHSDLLAERAFPLL